MKKVYQVVVCLALGTLAASAEPVFSFNEVEANRYSITLSEDIVFSITTNAVDLGAFLIWDGAGSSSVDKTWASVSGDISLGYNGDSYDIDTWVDALSVNIGAATADDSYFFASLFPATVSEGDVITLTAGTVAMVSADPDFSVPNNGDYDIFLVDNSGLKLTENYGTTSVPEPSTVSLLALVGSALVFVRRRLRN